MASITTQVNTARSRTSSELQAMYVSAKHGYAATLHFFPFSFQFSFVSVPFSWFVRRTSCFSQSGAEKTATFY